MRRYKLEQSKTFEKNFTKCQKRGKNLKKFYDVVEMLIKGVQLPSKYKDHKLNGYRENQNIRECHIEPDWLLVYEKKEKELILILMQIGTHSDLF